MDFALNELQRELSELAGKILRDASSEQHLNDLETSGNRVDRQLWGQLRESGLTAIACAEEFGGAGLGFLDLCLVLEQVGKTVAAVPLMGHAIAALCLQQAGKGNELTAHLESASWLACSARTWGNSLQLVDGKMQGELAAIPYARDCEAMLVPVKVEGDWRVCLLPREQNQLMLSEQTATSLEPLAKLSASAAEVTVIGDASLLSWLRERLVVGACAMQTGVVDEAITMSKDYISEREQFGVKIGSFQSVSHRMADAWIDLANLRLITQSAAVMLEQQASAPLEVLSAQVWSAEAGHRVLASCQHVHGGMGHDRDYRLWRYAIWARNLELANGGAKQALGELGQVIANAPEAAFL